MSGRLSHRCAPSPQGTSECRSFHRPHSGTLSATGDCSIRLHHEYYDQCSRRLADPRSSTPQACMGALAPTRNCDRERMPHCACRACIHSHLDAVLEGRGDPHFPEPLLAHHLIRAVSEFWLSLRVCSDLTLRGLVHRLWRAASSLSKRVCGLGTVGLAHARISAHHASVTHMLDVHEHVLHIGRAGRRFSRIC